jgi:hypothetical protein
MNLRPLDTLYGRLLLAVAIWTTVFTSAQADNVPYSLTIHAHNYQRQEPNDSLVSHHAAWNLWHETMLRRTLPHFEVEHAASTAGVAMPMSSGGTTGGLNFSNNWSSSMPDFGGLTDSLQDLLSQLTGGFPGSGSTPSDPSCPSLPGCPTYDPCPSYDPCPTPPVWCNDPPPCQPPVDCPPPNPVPEPSSLALLGIGLALLGILKRGWSK